MATTAVATRAACGGGLAVFNLATGPSAPTRRLSPRRVLELRPSLLPLHRIPPVQRHGANTARDIAVNVVNEVPTSETATGTELPQVVQELQAAWEKLDDKYSVVALAVAALIGLISANGVVTAIDKLPILPGVLELIGIGYTGWFIYGNLLYTPDREALVEKIKTTYDDIMGSS